MIAQSQVRHQAQRLIAGLLVNSIFCSLPVAYAQLTVPQLTGAPTIDGDVNPREWIGAAILPPLGQQPGNLVNAHHTRIYLGWKDASLYVGVESLKGRAAAIVTSDAETFPELKSADNLDLTISGNSSGGSLILWPTKIFFVFGDQPVARNWTGQVRHDEVGWQAEAQLPLSQLGIDPAAGATIHLDVALNRPSQRLPAARLAAEMTLISQNLAVRFLEGGPFVGGSSQGLRIELVNAGNESLTGSTKLTLRGTSGEARDFSEALSLPADSLRRVQLAQPLSSGAYGVEYDVALGSVALARGAFAFESGGALQIELMPFFLWRDGIFVKATVPEPLDSPSTQPTPIELTAKLLDAAESTTLSQSSAAAQRPGAAELFISTKDLDSGVYVVHVIATADGKMIAAQKQRITKPPLPPWWKSRDRRMN